MTLHSSGTMLSAKTLRGILADGTTYYEHEIGDFVTRAGPFITETSFTQEDALAVSALLQCFAKPSQILIALYPWAEPAWKDVIEQDWTTLHVQTFVRHRWLGKAGSIPWQVGYAHSAEHLEEVVYWAWTLPGRDTLLFVPITTLDVGPLVKLFKDDEEDRDTNELTLLQHYPTVVSRGFQGRYVRLFSRVIDESAVTKCLSSIHRD